MQILRKIGKILSYLPLLWADEDWDHAYVLILLRHKLRRKERFFRLHGHLANRHKNALQMRRCLFVVDRLIADDYFENVHKGPFKHNWYIREENNHNADLAYLTTQLRKHLRTWWD